MIGLSSFIAFLANMIQDEPGFIVGPISWVLGGILNIVYELVSFVTENYSLGISIIVVTIIARLIMLPLAFKQQKSMVIMRKIQPEIKKIQDKYQNDLADPEVKRKMNMEMQQLYSKHKYNPFSGCLPLIIQLPIFIALYYIMQNSYVFIDTVNELYTDVATVIVQQVEEDKDNGGKELLAKVGEVEQIRVKNEKDRTANEAKLLADFDSNKYTFWYNFSTKEIAPMIPEDMTFEYLKKEDMIKAFDKLSTEQWDKIENVFTDDSIKQNLERKNNIEYFGFGINLTEVAGFGFPGIIVTLLSGLTTFLSSWLMMRKNSNVSGPAQSQQKIMMITMPLIMAWITSGLPCGVGLYWIISNIFMIVQQQALNKYYENKVVIEDNSKKRVVIDEAPKKKGKK